jgi:hypothetical protein
MTRRHSGEFVQFLQACAGFNSDSEIIAAGTAEIDRYTALATRVVNGEEGALMGCRVAAKSYMKTAGKASKYAGQQRLATAFKPYRPQQ